MKRSKKFISVILFVLIAAMLLPGSAFAATGEAAVTASALNMRSGQSTSSDIVDVAPWGATVYVTEDNGTGWYKVSYNGKTGYMSADYLSFSGVDTTAATTMSNGNGTVKGTYVRFRSGPSMNSDVIDYLHTGIGIQINGACGSWYEVVYNGQTGYIYGDYVVVGNTSAVYTITTPAVTVDMAPVYSEPSQPEAVPVVPENTVPAQTAPAQTTTTEPAPPSAVTSVGVVTGQMIVDKALSFQGVPYVWAGTSPDGFDCSGLVYYVYGLFGYDLNRVAQAMYYNGTDVDISNLNNLLPGDILLFGSSVSNIWHAAIYVGNGIFVHAPYSGQVVSKQALADTYGMRLVAARRIV